MHYKNGRVAQNGDKVMVVPTYGPPVVGILYDAQPGNDYCNGHIAPISPNNVCPNLKECLHLDDALALLNQPAETAESTTEAQSATGETAPTGPVDPPRPDRKIDVA